MHPVRSAAGIGRHDASRGPPVHVRVILPADPEASNRFRGKKNRYTLAFAAYNAGPRAVVQYGGVPPYAETQNYVVKVERAWRHVAAILHLRPTHINVARQDAAQFKYWTGE